MLATIITIMMLYWLPGLAGAIYVAVALMWLVPDHRIERILATRPK